jgi:N-acetylmuramoyl-L-alanine amidase
LVDTWQDTPLNIRCAKANQINKDKKSVLISIHSDGFGSGDWNPANGVTVFHAPNASPKSKVFAGLLGAQFKTNFETYSRFRGVKSGDFAIIRDTDCPAVLLELGFHTNKREANLMITEDFKQRAVQCIVNAIKAFEQV